MSSKQADSWGLWVNGEYLGTFYTPMEQVKFEPERGWEPSETSYVKGAMQYVYEEVVIEVTPRND